MHRPRISVPAHARWLILLLLLAATIAAIRAPLPNPGAAPVSGPAATLPELVSTFSIVAFDADTGDLGVAVQSKFFAVGPVVPFAAAGIGAVATQSYANTSYGPRGLDMLRDGLDPQEVIDRLIADDPDRGLRQVGLIDAAGVAVNYTGDACIPFAGGRVGDHFTVQGNILAGPEVLDAMAATFAATAGDLAARMVAALAAGQTAGGDMRGRQSAALLVVREGGGYGGFNDRFIDLRVDDHATPIRELQRLLDIRHGQLLGDEGQRLIQAHADASAAERAALLEQAIEAFTEASRLNPADGWGWMNLAAAQLVAEAPEAAAAAGVQALRADPWIKTAIMQGIFGSVSVVEELLADSEFRKVWETISIR